MNKMLAIVRASFPIEAPYRKPCSDYFIHDEKIGTYSFQL